MNFQPSDEKYMLAKTTADPQVIEQFSHHEDSWIRIFVAQNINTSSETLEFLSHDGDFAVRYAVALNPNTSLETLRQMAIHDKVYYVSDEDYLLRCYVAQNPTLQPTLEFLSTQEKIRLAETSNDPKILDSLAQDKNSDVRWRVLLNSNTSSLTKLSITF